MKKVIFSVLAAACACTCWAGDRIMVYGDSNTFGWLYEPDGTVTRMDPAQTWPEVMARALGKDATVITEGLGGRTTDVHDAIDAGSGRIAGAAMNGLEYLPAALSSHMPLDLVIIMLGTNDVQAYLHRTTGDIALGLGRLAQLVLGGQWQDRTRFKNPQVLVITPPKVDDSKTPRKAVWAGALKKTEELPGLTRPIIEALGGHFMEGAKVIEYAEEPDQVHLTREQHQKLGQAVAAEVKKILGR